VPVLDACYTKRPETSGRQNAGAYTIAPVLTVKMVPVRGVSHLQNGRIGVTSVCDVTVNLIKNQGDYDQMVIKTT